MCTPHLLVFVRRVAPALLAIAMIALMPSAFASNAPAAVQPSRDVPREQLPRTTFPYDVEQVSFPGGASGVVLSGTLTRPKTTRTTAAVVLIHGSGKTDRDETAFGHKPFLVLADAFTRAGYAVLRYDKRGVGKSTGDGRAATTLDFKADADAAISYLRTRSDIDTTRIAVVGHSEGGTIAALMSADSSPPAAAVLLAGMIAPFAEQITMQEVLTGRDEGADASYEQAVRDYYAKVEAAARTDDDKQRLAQMQAISAAWNARFPAGSPDYSAASDSLLANPKFIASHWFRAFLMLDVPNDIRRGRIPILFLNGSSDHQVVATPNLEAARKALGRESALRRTQLLPGLNHLFQESASGSVEDYARAIPTPAPIAISAVIQFLNLALKDNK